MNENKNTTQEHEKYKNFHLELLDRAKTYFVQKDGNKKANTHFWIKAVFWGVMVVMFYLLFLWSNSLLISSFSAILSGVSLLFFIINVAHDAAHFSVFENRKYNQWLYNFCFLIMGNSPQIWQKNHCIGHHNQPNVIGSDPDVIETPLLRFHKEKIARSFHRFQALYAPLLYLIHAPIYYFITEPFLLFTEKKTILKPIDRFLPILGKIFSLYMMVYLPSRLKMDYWTFYFALFVVIQMLYSLILVFALGISHLNTKTLFISEEKNRLMPEPPIKIQLLASADYNCNDSFTHFLLGGFNTHGLHHLFPNVCHVHYKNLAPILIETARKHNIPYQTYTYWSLLKSHFALLYEMGNSKK